MVVCVSRLAVRLEKTPERPRQRLFRARREQDFRSVHFSFIAVARFTAISGTQFLLHFWLCPAVPSGSNPQTPEVQDHQPRQGGSHSSGVQRRYPRIPHRWGNVSPRLLRHPSCSVVQPKTRFCFRFWSWQETHQRTLRWRESPHVICSSPSEEMRSWILWSRPPSLVEVRSCSAGSL